MENPVKIGGNEKTVKIDDFYVELFFFDSRGGGELVSLIFVTTDNSKNLSYK